MLRQSLIATVLVVFAATPCHADSEAGTEFERLLASYGQINTIAGRGLTNNSNGWFANMENGAATSAELSRPHMAHADDAGNVYIADKLAHAIRKVSPDGIITTVAGTLMRGDGGEGPGNTTPLREPNGLYTFPDGTTYILDLDENIGSGKIRRLGTDGNLTTIITDPILPVGRGLWVSPDETTIYYSAGTVVKRWTEIDGIETFATGFTQLGNLDIDPTTGEVCVTDRSANRAYRLSTDGTTRTVIAGNGTEGNGTNGQLAVNTTLEQVRGIAFRPDGSFFVCTHKGDHAVWFVDTTGLAWKLIDGQNNAHSGDGTPIANLPQNVISEPRAIAIAPNGDLLITEKDEGHIRRITYTCVEPEIVNFDTTTGKLTWTTHREGNYVIEESRDLKTWQGILDVETSNGSTTSTILAPGFPRVYFRAVSE